MLDKLSKTNRSKLEKARAMLGKPPVEPAPFERFEHDGITYQIERHSKPYCDGYLLCIVSSATDIDGEPRVLSTGVTFDTREEAVGAAMARELVGDGASRSCGRRLSRNGA